MDSVIVADCRKERRMIDVMKKRELDITKDLDIMRQREKKKASKIALTIHTEI